MIAEVLLAPLRATKGFLALEEAVERSVGKPAAAFGLVEGARVAVAGALSRGRRTLIVAPSDQAAMRTACAVRRRARGPRGSLPCAASDGPHRRRVAMRSDAICTAWPAAPQTGAAANLRCGYEGRLEASLSPARSFSSPLSYWSWISFRRSSYVA